MAAVLCGCPRHRESAAKEAAANPEPAANQEPPANPEPAATKESRHPFENVTPEKVKGRLEKIQRDEDERDERRLREAQ